MNMRNCKVEFSENGSSWSDGSGHSNSVAWDGGEKATEETHVFNSDTPTVDAGPNAGVTVTAHILYTETPGEVRAVAQAAYDNTTLLYLRWSPRNAVSGSKMYTACGYVKKPLFPAGEKASAAAIMMDLVIHAPKVDESTVTP